MAKIDKKKLKIYLLKYLGDIKKIKIILFQNENLDISEDELKNFINKKQKYYKSTFDDIEKIKFIEAEKKLFQLVQSGNIKAVELFLKRKDEKEKDSKDKNIKISLSLPDNIKEI
jgi:hypothetical protein